MSQIRQAQMFKKYEHSIIQSLKGETDDHEWLKDLITGDTASLNGKTVEKIIKEMPIPTIQALAV